MKNKAIILGAGPAGLVTAWKLLEANWDVTIIEKNNISHSREIIKKILEKKFWRFID